MRFFPKNRRLYTIWNSYWTMCRRFSTILHAHYGKYLRRYAGNGFSAENEYLYEFLYTGILGVLQKWLQNECKDDRNQVADVMWRMIVQSLPHTKNPHSFSSLS